MLCLGQAIWEGTSQRACTHTHTHTQKLQLFPTWPVDSRINLKSSCMCLWDLPHLPSYDNSADKSQVHVSFYLLEFLPSLTKSQRSFFLYVPAFLLLVWNRWFISFGLNILAEIGQEDNYYVQMYIEHSLWDTRLFNVYKKKRSC